MLAPARDLPPPTEPPAAPEAAGQEPPEPATESPWRAARSRWWQLMAAGVGVLLVLATCAAFSYRLVQDELAGRNARASSEDAPAIVPRDISSREVDQEPLTVDEIFPEETIVVNPEEPPYQVLASEARKKCALAAEDKLAALLRKLGCSQVIRATLRSPNEEYLITGGVFNLKDQQGANQAYDDIKPLIEKGTGRFSGLLAGEGTEPIVLSETVAVWDVRGHYLMYTLIARADGTEFAAADNRYADLIGWDIIEVHLRGTVLERRATQPNPELAPTAPPATTPPPATPTPNGGQDQG